MDIRRPGKAKSASNKSGTKFYITVLLILGVMVMFWFNLKDFESTENKVINEVRDYIPSPHAGTVYQKPFFSLSYDEKYELAEWVAYRLTRNMLDKPKHPRDQDFNPDPDISTGSAHYHDYKQSGYTKGHLVPAADMSWNTDAMNATFLMSNVAPMKEEFNSGIWLELEHDVRDWARQHSNIIVITGPVMHDSIGWIGKNDVLVPAYFYKAVFTADHGKPRSIGFILNQNESYFGTLDQYVVSIDEIERKTGLDLFPNMYGSWENEIQSEKKKDYSFSDWPFNPKWYTERMENH